MQSKNDIVKRYVYDVQIKDIEDKILDIFNLVINTALNGNLGEVENDIPSITNLITNTSLNAKINEIKKISNMTNLATITALTAVGTKIPDACKYITIPEFVKLTAENFTARLKQAILATDVDIADFIKETGFDVKLKNLNKKVT